MRHPDRPKSPSALDTATGRRIILAAVDAMTDAELVRLAHEIRRGQTAPLTGRERVEHCGPSEPFKPYVWSWLREHPAGCACLPCRNKVM